VALGIVAAIAIAGMAWAGWTRPAIRAAPLTDVERRGAVLYQANCASCHGTAGEGQANWKSPRADGSRPAPPHDISGHTWHHPDAVIFGIVKEGGSYGAPPGYPAAMPGFRVTLSDQQIVEVLTYVKTMWGDKERQYQRTMSEAGPFPGDARQ
jgi:mono/diheme cytochrome c family protein